MQEEIVVQIKSSLGPFYRDCLWSRPMYQLYKNQLKNSPHSFWEGLSLAPAIFSYVAGYYLPRKLRSQGRTFDIDSSDRITQDPNLQGAPIGGIGSGFMTRSFLGSFTRYHFRTGDVRNVDIPINQFSLAVHPTGTSKSKRQAMVLNPSPLVNRSKVGKRWNWWDLNVDPLKQKRRSQTPSFFRNMSGVYHCRYPLSFYEYEKTDTFRIVQKQYSPVIPGDYENSCLPIGIFRHGIENLSDEPLTFSLMMTFQNGTGENCKSGGHFNKTKKRKIKRKLIDRFAGGKSEEESEEEKEGESSSEEEEEKKKKTKQHDEEEEEEEDVEAVWVEMHSNYQHQISTGLISSEKHKDPLVFGVGVIPECVGKAHSEEEEGEGEFEEIVGGKDSDDEEEEKKNKKNKKSEKNKKKSYSELLKEGSCDEFEISVCETFRSSSKLQTNSLWEMFETEGSIGNVNEYIQFKRQERKSLQSGSFFGLSTVDKDEVSDTIKDMNIIDDDSSEEKKKSKNKKKDIAAPKINLKKSRRKLLREEMEKRKKDVSSPGESIATAVCVKITVPPKQHRSFTFILGFHHPIARFQENAFTKQYMKYFQDEEEEEEENKTKNSSVIERLMVRSFKKYQEWDQQITLFQEPILQNPELPEDYKLALFNELYFLVAGGTVWTYEKIISENNRRIEEHFGLLEGQEYHMFNTYDVYVYASFALLLLYPEIQKLIQTDFANFIVSEDDNKVNFGSGSGKRKVLGAVPHDLGSPHEAPFEKSNSYCFQNTNRWKDLGSHYVCSLCRDVKHTKDRKLLESCFPAAKMVIEYYLNNFVNEKTGLIENEGFPDQTYDQWSMKGVTSYCGVLWMSAVASYIAMCQEMGDEDQVKEIEKYTLLLVKAVTFFEKNMWVKKPMYYRHSYATARKKCDSIHLDALLGHLFLRSSELNPVLKVSRIAKAIRTMYNLNVKVGEGVNGMKPDGKPDESNQQAKEVWTGTNYAFAAILMYEGFRHMSFSTVQQIHFSCWRKHGFIFQTPEAYFPKTGTYRALAYCRPLSIWAVQMAYEWSKKKEDMMWKLNLKLAELEAKKKEERRQKKKKEKSGEKEEEEVEEEVRIEEKVKKKEKDDDDDDDEKEEKEKETEREKKE